MQVQTVIETANECFGAEYPAYHNVPLPLSRNRIEQLPALWTRDGFRPRWGNLALAAAQTTPNRPPAWWEKEIAQQTIPSTILVASDTYLFLEYTSRGTVEITDITDTLFQELKRLRERLFSPKSLSKFKTGQLSFADLEDKWTEGFAQHMQREQRRLDEALAQSVKQAIEAQKDTSKQGLDDIFKAALAYMAARILEDKGFFGGETLPSNDPVALLSQTVVKANGFFQDANQIVSHLNDDAVQALASKLGKVVSFALTDHRDIGRLYEQALKTVVAFSKDKKEEWAADSLLGLQQYYTPVALAQQMLAHLPLERIRPEERVVYDPASGSGSLLLAASHRLSQMVDVAMQDDAGRLVAKNVLGNDLDPNAHSLTKLRYFLMQEAFGELTSLLPSPEYFGKLNYLSDDAWAGLPKRPTVIVANPPFKEEGPVQLAAQFVSNVLPRLRSGDQFAFILPRAFLTATTHGWKEAQTAIAEYCQILDVWQFSQGIVGLTADTDVSVVSGIVGPPSPQYAIARSMLAGNKSLKSATIEEGFLGQARIQPIGYGSDLQGFTAPKITLSIPTIRLGDLFYACGGVTPRKDFPRLSKGQLQFVENINERKVKRYWQHSWLSTGSLWANPANVPKDEKYTIYDNDYLYRASTENETIYDSPKVLISRSTNWTAKDPLPTYFDTEGFCPSKHTYCVVPLENVNHTIVVPPGWDLLSYNEKLLWLVGILNSRLLKEWSKLGRGSRQLLKEHLLSLPLPAKVDYKIIEITRHIIDLERDIRQDDEIDALKERLDKLVQQSYGNPYIPPAIDYNAIAREWANERKEDCFVATGRILDVDPQQMQVLLYLNNLDDEIEEAWVPLPQNMPAWALDGTVFDVDIPRNIRTFAELADRPWALQNFQHTRRPYLSFEELRSQLLTKLGVV